MSTATGSTALSAWGGGVEQALHELDARKDALIARTEAWSAINSGSFETAGLARMRAELAPALAALPGAVEEAQLEPTARVRADGETFAVEHGASLRLRVRPDAPIQVALTGHYDTVFPAAHAFQKPIRADSKTLRGPGVADMKGGIAVMLAALEAFEALPGEKRVGYEVLLSPDEEIGSPASAALLAQLGARAHLGMTYEPAHGDGSLVDARKGSGNSRLVLRGTAAHVGRAFAEGRNAVVAAAQAAMALNALNGQRNGVTFNVGAIDGGSAVNVVPDNAVLRFNARAPDADLAVWADQQIKLVAMNANAHGVIATLHGGITRPPKPLDEKQHALIGWTKRAGAALGIDLKFGPSGGVCEGNNLAAAGCPNIDTLGPCGGGLHSDQEFALIDSFTERAKLSLLLLAGVNSGAFDLRELRP